MTNRYVTVRRYSSPQEAHLARAKLESEGIPAVIQDENLVRMNWLYSNAIGGVKLQVGNSQIEAANQILGAVDNAEPNSGASDPCPECGADDTHLKIRGKRATFLTWLFAGVPLWRGRREWFCAACQHTWK